MIGRLTGRVASEELAGGVVLDVGGVGYDLLCPIGTISRAERSEATDAFVVLHVHTHLRQDALELFGFCSLEERSTFRLLVGVPGVGPRLALSILHVLPAQPLAEAIEAEDRPRLEKVPGVGKKTAERLVLELRGKLNARPRPVAGLAGPTAPISRARVVGALTSLGYRPQEAERAAKAVEESEPAGDLSAQLRGALKYLTP